MSDTARWLDHEFTIYTNDTDWNAVAGLYIFAGENSKGQWFPLYIGQTESLAERLPNHEDWPEAEILAATHIHARVEADESRRLALEAQLIQHYQPHLNVQMKG